LSALSQRWKAWLQLRGSQGRAAFLLRVDDGRFAQLDFRAAAAGRQFWINGRDPPGPARRPRDAGSCAGTRTASLTQRGGGGGAGLDGQPADRHRFPFMKRTGNDRVSDNSATRLC